MPISENLSLQATYAAALDGFVAAYVPARGMGGLLQSYAAVRQMPYFSGPDRTPLAALRSGRGACTAKHIILRDVLRKIGARAEVEIVEGDFASGIPLHSTQSRELQEMIRQGGVIDFHCRVRLLQGEGNLLLDATWPAELANHGFTVNRQWAGKGDTVQAISMVTVRSREEDVLGTKARLLAGLGAEMTARRQEFLRLLSGWLAELSPV